ncbi:MAG: hypothetical protein ACXWPM_04010, partial [Bdellovibrionota bacterium]
MNFSKRLGIFTMTAFAAFTMAMAQAFADGTATPTPVVTPPPVLDTAGYIGLVLSLARVGGTFSVMGDNSLNKDLTRSDHLYLGGGGELMLHFARSETTANAGFLGGGFNLQVGGARSLDSSHPNPSVTADLNLDLELGKPRVAPGGGPLPAPIMAKLAWNPYHRTPSTQEMGIPGGGLHATGELNGHWIYFDLIANPFTFSQNFALGTTGYQSTLDANLRAQLVYTKKVILSLDVGGKGGI